MRSLVPLPADEAAAPRCAAKTRLLMETAVEYIITT